MTYKLLIGNNFILGNPKKVKFNDSQIFSMDEDNQDPYINGELFDIGGTKIMDIVKNNIIFCSQELSQKYKERDHILIVNKDGEILNNNHNVKENSSNRCSS